MKPLYFLSVFLVTLCMFSCNSLKKKNESFMYIYFDQNRNEYHIFKDKIKFIPIKPEQSSSGVYDGGTEKITAISQLQYTEISEKLSEMVSNPALQTDYMGKLTSLVKIPTADTYFIFIQSDTRTALEERLQSLFSHPE